MKRKKNIEGIIISRFILYTAGIWIVRVAAEAFVSFFFRGYHVFGTGLTFAELAFVPPDERTWAAEPYIAATIAASLIWVSVSFLIYWAGIKLFGRGISRKIIEPVRHMSEGFSEISSGNLDVRLDFKTETEFSEMRDSFNAMAHKLKESEEQRSAMERERMRLFSHIAHDLKTPMTTISGYAEALTSGIVEESDKKMEYIRAISAKSNQLNMLIEQLLSYSKMGAPKYKAKLERADLAELLRAVCALLFGEIENKRMKLELDLPDKPLFCMVDSSELTRAVSNLLTNAIRHNPAGTLLYAGLTERQDYIEIKIADSGAPIPESIADNLFEPFVSGSDSRSAGSGTGLGLAIVRKIAEQHSGEVFVSEAVAPHTKMFVLKLPRI